MPTINLGRCNSRHRGGPQSFRNGYPHHDGLAAPAICNTYLLLSRKTPLSRLCSRQQQWMRTTELLYLPVALVSSDNWLSTVSSLRTPVSERARKNFSVTMLATPNETQRNVLYSVFIYLHPYMQRERLMYRSLGRFKREASDHIYMYITFINIFYNHSSSRFYILLSR